MKLRDITKVLLPNEPIFLDDEDEFYYLADRFDAKRLSSKLDREVESLSSCVSNNSIQGIRVHLVPIDDKEDTSLVDKLYDNVVAATNLPSELLGDEKSTKAFISAIVDTIKEIDPD